MTAPKPRTAMLGAIHGPNIAKINPKDFAMFTAGATDLGPCVI